VDPSGAYIEFANAGVVVQAASATAGTTTFFNNGAGETTTRRRVDVSSSTTAATYVSNLVSTVKGYDTDFSDYGGFTNNRIQVSAGSATTVLFTDDGTGDGDGGGTTQIGTGIVVDPTGLLTSTGTRAVNQENSYTVRKTAATYRDFESFKFASTPTDGDSVVINGISYSFQSAETASNGDTVVRTVNAASATAADIAVMIADLEAAIEANDPKFAAGASSIRSRAAQNSATVDTLVLSTLDATYDVTFAASFLAAAVPSEADGTASYTAGTAFAIDKKNAIVFDSDGIPSSFNIAEIEILDYSNGSANMDDDPSNSPQITLDLGTVNEANGMTQFGGSFTPAFITQNGSQFGTFAGVTVAVDGLVTALFDNGETRPVYKLPIATFTNVNQMGARSGNVWNATEASGDPTLREADNGPAGQVIQGSLEASTVDIGEEFTKMIVVQRAFSASAKIISTADEMLEELLRVKR